MSIRPLMLCIAAAAIAGGGRVAAAERQPRYVALLANGQRIEGDRLSNWYDGGGVPHLGNQSLLAPTNPFRWLRDRTKRLPEAPEAYIEFASGDRLPGVVTGYSDGQDDPYQPLPPHLIVRVALTFEPPENKPVPEIRVLTQLVKRIVWRKRTDAPPQPGTAVYHDGRTLAFRAIRFRSGEINVLLNTGGERIAWDELTELNLAATDSWQSWFDQVVAVCPNPGTRLLEIETSTGLVATASFARLAARFEGNSADPDRWVHGLQPAWSLDILWVPFREIACYRSYAANEVPLQRIAPRDVQQRGGFNGSSRVQINRNVHGGALASKTLEFGWGLGVGGGAELTFDLPPGAQALRAAVCLDRSAGDGGCVRPRILANQEGRQALWEGPVLIGSEKTADTSVVALDTNMAGGISIILQVDPLLADRPAGADPLDIRDHANWCDPLIEFDSAAIQTEFDKRLAQRFFAWNDWHVSLEGDAAAANLQTTFHRANAIPGSFWPAVSAEQSPLVLRREWASTGKEAWLVISVTRAKPGLPDPRIEVRIGGRIAGEVAITEPRRGEEAKLLVVHLPAAIKSSGRAIPIEIRQQAQEKGHGVVWRSITVADQPPARFRLFEDEAEPQLVAGDDGGGSMATLVKDDRYSGTHALQVTPGGRFRIELPAAIRVREQPRLGEARFVRFVVRTRGNARAAIELEDVQPREKPARYDVGTGPAAFGAAVRVADEAQLEWIVITRDLFADFGTLDVRALIVGCEGGEAALFDHVYLARTRADFEPIDVGKKGKNP